MRPQRFPQPNSIALMIVAAGAVIVAILKLYPLAPLPEPPPFPASDHAQAAQAEAGNGGADEEPEHSSDTAILPGSLEASAPTAPRSGHAADNSQSAAATAAPTNAKKLNAYGQVLAVPRRRIDTNQPATGQLHVFVLDQHWLVLAGDFNDFLVREIHDSFGQRLALADRLYRENSLPQWAHRFFYNYAAATVLPLFHEVIRGTFTRKDFFVVSSHDPSQAIVIAQQGYWVNAVGEFRLPWITGDEFMHTFSGELVHFAYICLERPLRNGEKITVKTSDGAMQTQLRYHDRESISRAIKVNQCGYLADAPQKYAYLGMWLAELGPMAVEQYVGRDFMLLRDDNQQAVFTGKIEARSNEQFHLRETTLTPLNGEDVLQMDFSSFCTPGTYALHIPGVGRSWSFMIGDDAIGRPFYLAMRGLFHQRSGMAKTSTHTAWEIPADRMEVFRGGFAPDDRQYSDSPQTGRITDSNGKHVKIKPFDMVKATATNERIPTLHGGWWDAGDFDRRQQHFRVVECLLAAYLLFPDNFRDGQLQLPESGNGLPDILDEALWGMDLWRRAQNAAGGVGCWIEAVSHPANPDPSANTQPYYLALPTKASSLEYAAYAASLARALRRAGDADRAGLFHASALLAWQFAHGDQAPIVKAFTHPTLGELTYREPAELPPEIEFRAALSLYLWDHDERFAAPLANAALADAAFRFARLHQRPYFLCELAEDDGLLPDLSERYRQDVLLEADKLLASQRELAYRNINWPIHHPYFLLMGWGAVLPFQRGAAFIVAWRLTGEARYRAAALLLADWMAGANPMGRAMTTGLGAVYPVRILSLPMLAREQRSPDPIPGITPYTFTGTNNYAAATSIFTITIDARRDQQFTGVNVSLLPDAWTHGRAVTVPECFAILQRQLPVWRRFANLESRAVAQNEFTVWETIAPAAAAYGALLPKNWQPPEHWPHQQPKKSLAELHGYIFLP